MKEIAGFVIAFGALASRANAQCLGDEDYRRSVAVRSMVRDFVYADTLWRDDIDHSLDVAHGSRWRVGAAAQYTFHSIPSTPCDVTAFPARSSLSSGLGLYTATFFDTEREIELRAFDEEAFDSLSSSVGRTGSEFTLENVVKRRGFAGGAVRTKYVEAIYGFERPSGHYVRLGSPYLGFSWDLLQPEHSQADIKFATKPYDVWGPFGLGLSGENRPSGHMSWLEPRVRIAARDGESHLGGYGALAYAAYPYGFQAATAGLELDGVGIQDGPDPVLWGRLRVYAEGTAFDVARGSRADGEDPRHSVLGGFATGLSVMVGGSVCSFGSDVRVGLNRPDLLRDVPSLHGHLDVALMGSFRLTPPLPKRLGVRPPPS